MSDIGYRGLDDYTILGAPYHNYTIMGPQNRILIVKAPILHDLWRFTKVWRLRVIDFWGAQVW